MARSMARCVGFLMTATVAGATVLASVGCAMSPTSARTGHGATQDGGRRAKGSEPVAQRLYQVGEEKFAAGHPEEAVALWRHAITQLPQTEDYDNLRHRLILRLGFGQVVAYHASGKLAHLFDGKRMLDRYLVAHQSLFGETEAAKRERGEVYELLYELESRIEDPPETVEAGTAVGLVAGDDEAATTTADATPPESRSKSKRRKRRAVEDAEGDERTVVVDTHGRPSVDDPEMKRELTRWNPQAGLIMTAASIEPSLPARAYVRIDGLPRRIDGGDQELGQTRAPGLAAEIVRSVRPALRACYDGAFTRTPTDYALATVEVDVADDGSVGGAVIAAGVVGDAIGDACVLEHLAKARVAEGDAQPMRLKIDLMFFFDQKVDFNEGSGRAVRNELDLMVDALAGSTSARRRGRSTEVPRGLPGIER